MTVTTIDHQVCDRCQEEVRTEPGLVLNGWSRIELPFKINGKSAKDLCDGCTTAFVAWMTYSEEPPQC